MWVYMAHRNFYYAFVVGQFNWYHVSYSSIELKQIKSNHTDWPYTYVHNLLTKLFNFFANGSLIRRLAVWIQLTWWVCAFDVGPTTLFVTNNADIKWIVTEGCVWCIWWTSPAFNGRRCKIKRGKNSIKFRFVQVKNKFRYQLNK